MDDRDLLESRVKAAKRTAKQVIPQRLQGEGLLERVEGGYLLRPEQLEAMLIDEALRVAIPRAPSTPTFVPRGQGGAVTRGNDRTDGLGGLRHETLRQVRESSSLVQAIHAARRAQIEQIARRWKGRPNDVGWEVVHVAHDDPSATVPKEAERVCKALTRLLERPAPQHQYHSLSSALLGLEDDLLTINQPVIEPMEGALFAGSVAGWRPLDGACIWPTLQLVERWVNDHPDYANGYRHINQADRLALVADGLGVDVYASEYVFVREGVAERGYRPGELIVYPRITRTNVSRLGYWPSCVEEASSVLLSFANALEYNSRLFTTGMMTDAMLVIGGTMTDAHFQSFVDQLREAAKGVERAHGMPILRDVDPKDMSLVKLKEMPKEMAFETFMALLVALTCAVYRMDPALINAKPWNAGGGASLSEASRFDEINLSREEGLQTDMLHHQLALTRLVQRIHPDYEVKWHWGDDDVKKAAELAEIQGRVFKTRNEIRVEQGEEPIGFYLNAEELKNATPEKQKEWHENIFNWPTDQTYSSAVSQQAFMQQQQEQEQPPGAAGAQPGDDDGYGMPPDIFGAMQGGGAPGGPQPPQEGAQPQPPNGGGAAPQQGLNKAADGPCRIILIRRTK